MSQIPPEGTPGSTSQDKKQIAPHRAHGLSRGESKYIEVVASMERAFETQTASYIAKFVQSEATSKGYKPILRLFTRHMKKAFPSITRDQYMINLVSECTKELILRMFFLLDDLVDIFDVRRLENCRRDRIDGELVMDCLKDFPTDNDTDKTPWIFLHGLIYTFKELVRAKQQDDSILNFFLQHVSDRTPLYMMIVIAAKYFERKKGNRTQSHFLHDGTEEEIDASFDFIPIRSDLVSRDGSLATISSSGMSRSSSLTFM